MAILTIKTADEFMDLDLEARWKARRAGRETQVFKQVLRAFLDRGGPIPVQDIAAVFPDSPGATIHQALGALDTDDLLRVRDGQIDVAYPFTASPTSFVIRLRNGTERFACCATDALGISPMIGQAVQIPVLFLVFSVLGGLALYGLIGLFVGPVLVSLLMTAIQIYREEYHNAETDTPASPATPP